MSMLDKFKSIVKDTVHVSKDTTNSTVFRAVLNQTFKSYGTVLAFKIDSKDRSFLIEVMMKGEKQPVRIEISKYEFITKGDDVSVIMYSIHANREWMQVVMDTFVLNKEFDLPKKLTAPIQAFM